MKLECSSCSMRYTIDDTIIPPLGAKVRCRKCGNTIVVPPIAPAEPVVPAPPEMSVVPPAAPAPAPAPAPPSPAASFMDSPALKPVTYTAPASTPVPPPAPMPVPPPPAANGDSGGSFSFFPSEGGSPAPAASAAPPRPAAPATTPSGLPEMLTADEKKQHEKARRLARVLASDIAIYNREKKDRGLAEGNLVAVLGYEIKKSWEIYKERVGADFANATPYFRDALNDLLAEGKKIF